MAKLQNMLKVTPELFEELSKLRTARLDDRGHEVLNPKPTVKNVSVRPPSLQEQIQRCLRVELSRQAMDQGAESFDEANDFDVPDDMSDPDSGYILMEDEVPIQESPFSLATSPAGESSHAGQTPVSETTENTEESAENEHTRA